jgi:arabinogalactan endo-1,4-beta-galactosidase
MKSSTLTALVWLPAVVTACSYRAQLVGEIQGADSGSTGVGGDANGRAAGGASRTTPFILGADLSWVQEEEDGGVTYVDAGVTGDILEILERHGFNWVRLRLFNDPSSPCRTSASGDVTCGYQFEGANRAQPYCDLAHTVEMAQRVKAAGMKFLLDFHYSDTWADPDDQNKPLTWEGLDFSALTAAVGTFTQDSLLTFAAAGALPDMVQLGNEITPGMLFPDGSSSAPGNFPRFAALLHAGVAAVRAVDPNILVMMHIEKPDSFATSDWWLENAIANGVEFDVLGQSCYPEWHGTSAEWTPTFVELAAKYPELDFVVAEYSQEKRAVNDMLFGLPGGRGLGSFIWEPTQWGETLFDRNGTQAVANTSMSLYDQMAADYDLR